MSTRAVVVGGGLAGITAAVRLADAGVAVTLREGRSRLGGATHSFRRDDWWLDNGQHVFLRCCTAYRDLLTRLGVADRVVLQRRLDVPVLAPGGRVDHLRRSRLPLPAPWHLGLSLSTYRPVPFVDRLRLLRAVRALADVDPDDPRTDTVTFGSWLRRHDQSRAAVESVWGLIATATLNVDPDAASLAGAAFVFRTGLLGAAAAADIGYSRVPLGELHGAAAERLLAGLGVRVALRSRVDEIRPAADGLRVVGSDGAETVDAVVLAVPHQDAARLLPEPARRGIDVGSWAALSASPIVNLHVGYDRRVTPLPFAAAVDSPVQWVFDRSVPAGATRGQYLAVSLSAADRYVDLPVARLRELFLPELARLFPAARTATVERFHVTRERRATFRAVPGTAAARPPTATGTPGLLLAGAWTATGWPDTMEGAVRSGTEAARQACAYLHSPARRRPLEGAVA